MEPRQESFDHAFGHQLQPTEARDLHRIEQIQTDAPGGRLDTVHRAGNVQTRPGESTRRPGVSREGRAARVRAMRLHDLPLACLLRPHDPPFPLFPGDPMLATWALALGLSPSLPPTHPALPAAAATDARVSVWTDRGSPYRQGDVVRVFASTGTTAYLTVFRIDTDGGVRVLFPREPWEDTWVRGGRVVDLNDGGAARFPGG